MYCVGNALMGKWIPVQERSRACTVTFLGRFLKRDDFSIQPFFLINNHENISKHSVVGWHWSFRLQCWIYFWWTISRNFQHLFGLAKHLLHNWVPFSVDFIAMDSFCFWHSTRLQKGISKGVGSHLQRNETKCDKWRCSKSATILSNGQIHQSLDCGNETFEFYFSLAKVNKKSFVPQNRLLPLFVTLSVTFSSSLEFQFIYEKCMVYLQKLWVYLWISKEILPQFRIF